MDYKQELNNFRNDEIFGESIDPASLEYLERFASYLDEKKYKQEN